MVELINRPYISIDIEMGKHRAELKVTTAGEGAMTISTSALASTFEPSGASILPLVLIVIGLISMSHEFKQHLISVRMR